MFDGAVLATPAAAVCKDTSPPCDCWLGSFQRPYVWQSCVPPPVALLSSPKYWRGHPTEHCAAVARPDSARYHITGRVNTARTSDDPTRGGSPRARSALVSSPSRRRSPEKPTRCSCPGNELLCNDPRYDHKPSQALPPRRNQCRPGAIRIPYRRSLWGEMKSSHYFWQGRPNSDTSPSRDNTSQRQQRLAFLLRLGSDFTVHSGSASLCVITYAGVLCWTSEPWC